MTRTLVLALALLALASPARAQSDVAAFEGFWSTRIEVGSAAPGELVLTQEAGVWRTSFAGAEAQADTLDVAFPDGSRLSGRRRGDAVEAW